MAVLHTRSCTPLHSSMRSSARLAEVRERLSLPQGTRSSSLAAKEVAQHRAALPFRDAAVDLRPVMAGRLLENARPVFDPAAFWVVGGEIKDRKSKRLNSSHV